MRRVAAFLAAALALTACGGGEVKSSTDAVARPSPSPTPSASPTLPETVSPLTGVPSVDPRQDQPIVAVKIDNSPQATPQAGLEVADVVFEELTEGGVSRFVALYHSALPPVVGPVRSGRLIDVEILEPMGAVMVYSGAREDVTAALARADHIGLLPDSGAPIYWRERGRPGSHDLMADPTLALEQGRELSDVSPAGGPWWSFSDEAPAGGTPAGTLDVRMSSFQHVTWEWDGEAEVYRRSQRGDPHQVTGDGRIGIANVIVILTDVGRGGCCDTAGQPFTATRFTGEGDAVLLRDGQRYEARWSKPSAGDHVRLDAPDGGPLPLARGVTWIHLAPLDAVGTAGQ